MDDRPIYSHMQDGRYVRIFILTIAGILFVPLFALEFFVAGGRMHASILLVVVPILIIVACPFSQMTIEVTETEERWKFALGIRENPSSLYGIREILLGTDDPDGPIAALRA
jgi:hypothetical protein